jgi:hypothetical protein
MSFKSRIARFLIFIGSISLFVFFASLLSPSQDYNYGAFLLGVILLVLGLPLRAARRAGPPAAKTAPPPPRPAAPAPKKQGLLKTLLKGPAPKQAAAPPPPPPPSPKKKGLAGLFSPKPKKK